MEVTSIPSTLPKFNISQNGLRSSQNNSDHVEHLPLLENDTRTEIHSNFRRGATSDAFNLLAGVEGQTSVVNEEVEQKGIRGS